MHDVSSGVTGHVCFHCRDHFGLGEKGLCPCDPPGGGCCFVTTMAAVLQPSTPEQFMAETELFSINEKYGASSAVSRKRN